MRDTPHNLRLDSTPASSASAASPARRSRLFTWYLVAVVLALAGTVGVDLAVWSRGQRYHAEIRRLRESMTALERTRADQIVTQEHHKLRLAVALLRRQARLERTLHLSVSVDSGAMYLERDGALLREMPIVVGPEKRIGIAPDTVRLAPPLGVRRVARVLTDADTWEVPGWVYADRGLPIPAERSVAGGLGQAAVLLDGGAIIYSLPATGPLADSTYVLPGAVRARADDLRAVLPNLAPGMRIYFF